MNEISPIFPDSRPQVRAREFRAAPWLFAGVVGIGGLLLFSSLETARLERQQTSGSLASQELAPARPLAELPIPPSPMQMPVNAMPSLETRPAVRLTAMRPESVRSVAPTFSAPVTAATSYPPPPVYAPPPEVATPQATGFPPDYEPIRAREPLRGGQAQRLAAPSFTVVQGTIIPAVLETAMDSTQPGPVRALVSRDVRGFDGQNILIPRGSRLIGEYQADLSPGQARAMVNWSRLITPDGVSINLRSPATDALGRAGIPGRVNNHTMRRLGDALLQTVINAGSGFSQRAAPTVLVVPGGSSATAPVMARDPSLVQPTLTVAQGARVSVFVSQDMDFSGVDDAS